MTSVTIAHRRISGLTVPRGLVATAGALVVVAGFLGPYLTAGIAPAETPRYVFGYELPFERISAMGTLAGRSAPIEWLLALAVVSLAGTLVIFALHYELLDRRGLATFLRTVSLLGVTATTALLVSVALRCASPVSAGPFAIVPHLAALAHGTRHVGPGLYVSLLGFVIARLDPTL